MRFKLYNHSFCRFRIRENMYHITMINVKAVVCRNLGVILTLFQPEGADYAHHITGSIPGFGNLTTALHSTVPLEEPLV